MDRFFEKVIMAANDAVLITKVASGPGSNASEIVFVNPAFTRITGYTAEEVLGRSPRMLQGPNTSEEAVREVARALNERRPVRVEILNYAKDGRECWLDLNIVPLVEDGGEVTHFAAIERDVTLHKEMELRLQQQASTDALTGLANRRSFLDLATAELARAQRYQRRFCLAIFDIDWFKRVNDTYGHGNGDKALQHVAEILRRESRTSDTCARYGGEEFAALFPETDENGGLIVAERMRRAVESAPVMIDGKPVPITISGGLAELRLDGPDDLDALFARADAALYAAKRAGRNRIKWAGDAEPRSMSSDARPTANGG
ncbi:MAG: diguanylate cyclase [Alphaproteobacteria bacterium]